MRSVQAQGAALAGMLAAATGNETRTSTTDSGAMRIEADLPSHLSTPTRSAVLTALALADRYGHARTDDSDTVWAELDMEAGK